MHLEPKPCYDGDPCRSSLHENADLNAIASLLATWKLYSEPIAPLGRGLGAFRTGASQVRLPYCTAWATGATEATSVEENSAVTPLEMAGT